MATLPGQRATFTWALNQYNLAEDPQTRAIWAKRMAKPIAAAPSNGFTVEQVTQGQNYPVAEVNQYINDPDVGDPGISEQQAISTVQGTVTQRIQCAQERGRALCTLTDIIVVQSA